MYIRCTRENWSVRAKFGPGGPAKIGVGAKSGQGFIKLHETTSCPVKFYICMVCYEL